MARKPLARQAFDAFEQPLSGALDRVIRSSVFADVTAASWKIAWRIRREFERNSERALHLWNLPAGTDVDRLLSQVARVERQVRDLSRELDEGRRKAPLRDAPGERPDERVQER